MAQHLLGETHEQQSGCDESESEVRKGGEMVKGSL